MPDKTCGEIRELLLAHERGQLDAADRAKVAAHLESCAGCQKAAAADRDLGELLMNKLPRYSAPPNLRLARPRVTPRQAPRVRQYAAPVLSALAAAALVLVLVRVTPPRLTTIDLVEEGVNDHLRVVASSHPVEIESGGIHQVKPWFTGRLDFAPPVSFVGDDQVQLLGGSVGYFRDRKAAVLVWKIRLHTISLLVFRAEGLPIFAHIERRSSRGFNVLLWRDHELGYCLVSDVNVADLDSLATKISAH